MLCSYALEFRLFEHCLRNEFFRLVCSVIIRNEYVNSFPYFVDIDWSKRVKKLNSLLFCFRNEKEKNKHAKKTWLFPTLNWFGLTKAEKRMLNSLFARYESLFCICLFSSFIYFNQCPQNKETEEENEFTAKDVLISEND